MNLNNYNHTDSNIHQSVSRNEMIDMMDNIIDSVTEDKPMKDLIMLVNPIFYEEMKSKFNTDTKSTLTSFNNIPVMVMDIEEKYKIIDISNINHMKGYSNPVSLKPDFYTDEQKGVEGYDD